MLRSLALLAFAPAFVAVAVGQVPDPGRPPIPLPGPFPPALGKIYIYNNTNEDAIVAISSARATVRSNVAPGNALLSYFVPDGKARVLTTFRTRTGDLVSNRAIRVIDGNYYDVIPNVVAPAVPAVAPAIDEGTKQPAVAPKAIQMEERP